MLSTIMPSKTEYINGLTVPASLIFLPSRSHWYPPTTDPVRHPTTNMEAGGREYQTGINRVRTSLPNQDPSCSVIFRESSPELYKMFSF